MELKAPGMNELGCWPPWSPKQIVFVFDPSRIIAFHRYTVEGHVPGGSLLPERSHLEYFEVNFEITCWSQGHGDSLIQSRVHGCGQRRTG